MPTAHDFDVAAAGFESAADVAESMLATAHAHFGPETMHGGRLPLLIDLTLDSQHRSARTAAHLLRRQADLCRDRAAACRAFAAELAVHRADMARWRQAQADPASAGDPVPPPPRAPGPWAEV